MNVTSSSSISAPATDAARRLRVMFCWQGMSGYMHACWRALAMRGEIDMAVICTSIGMSLDSQRTQQIPNLRILTKEEDSDAALTEQLVLAHKPDVVVVCGWFHKPFTRLATLPALRHAKFILAMDTPWRWELRQYLAKYKLAGYLRRMSGAVVTGERCWQYANRLGFPPDRILRGVYGIDYDLLSPAMNVRCQSGKPWPHTFLFVGRYAEVKSVDVLAEAYQRYRRDNPDPWKLICCGQGPLKAQLSGIEGLEDRGFLDPKDLPNAMAQAGCSVLPSRYDPWPLAIVESCAAGLPILCSDACGSHIELVRSFYNGRVTSTGDAASLAEAMRWMQDHADQLPEMGRRSQVFAGAYSARMWAERWSNFMKRLLVE